MEKPPGPSAAKIPAQLQSDAAAKAAMEERGKAGEATVDAFMGTVAGLELRDATPEEDSGVTAIVKDLAIDRVFSLNGTLAGVLQITTAMDSVVRAKKSKDLLDRPFVRLPQMRSTDIALPRILIFLDGTGALAFQADHDMSAHPELGFQIFESAISSLKIALMKTKNPKEQQLITQLIHAFTEAQLPYVKGKGKARQ